MAVTIFSVGNDAVATINANGSNGLNTGFLSYGNEINRVAAIVDAASTAGVASQLVKADASGIVKAAGGFSGNLVATTTLANAILAVAPSTLSAGIVARAFDSAAGHYGLLVQNGASGNVFTVDAVGAAVLNTSLSVPAIVGIALSSAAPINFRAFAAAVQPMIALSSGGGSPAITTAINSDGSATFASTVAASSFIGSGASLTGVVAASAATATTAGTASALVAPVSFTSVVSDYKPVVSSSAGTVVVSAGGAYEDSNGLTVGPLNAQNATMPTQPTGTNVQYVGVSLAVTTGAPVVTPGTVGASLGAITPPLLPVANKPDSMVIWRGATTNPSGIIAAADIIDLRIPGGGGGGGGGGTTDSAVRSDTHVLLNGPSSVMTGGVDATNPLSNIAISMAGLRDSVTDLDLGNLLGDYISGNVVGGIQAVGAQLRLAASPASPVRIRHAGRQRQITASATSPTSATGGAALWVLYADLTATGTTSFTVDVALASTFSPTTYQIELARCWWDGTQWQLGAGNALCDFNRILPVLPSTAIRPTYINSAVWTGTAMNTLSSFLVIPGAPTLTFYCSAAMQYHGWWQGLFTQGASAGNINLMPGVDGPVPGLTLNTGPWSTGASYGWLHYEFDVTLGIGSHALTMYYILGSGGTASTLTNATFGGILTR